jgi:hypothetical protein
VIVFRPARIRSRLPRLPRWLAWIAWFAVGWFTGVITLLALTVTSVTLAPIPHLLSGESDVRVEINVAYLNDVVRQRLERNPQAVVGNIKTTGLQLGLLPEAGLVLTPTFDLAGWVTLSPSVNNQLRVQDGKLAMTMVGEPRLGDTALPLGLLPFDVAAEIRNAVNQITNNVLLAELNDNLKAGFGSDQFNITDVQTNGNYLLVKMRRK